MIQNPQILESNIDKQSIQAKIYIKRFVNCYFKHIYQEQIENKEFKKQLYKEINLVKNDII
ncbi:MAG: hypothetical protein ACKO3I_04205, partial [Synechococcales cyanobacterium]